MYMPNFLDGFDRLVAFDAETTGKRTPDAEFIRKQPFAWRAPGIIIEVGFVEMLREGEGWRKGETWSSRVNPDGPIDPEAIKIHRIRPADLKNAPRFPTIAHWLGHLEYDWELPLARPFFLGLAKDYTLIRYDARGNGLSDWGVRELSLDAWVSDMETVADAAGLGRFPLLGVSQGCAVSIAYAARHPERVSHLILYGGFAVGTNKRP